MPGGYRLARGALWAVLPAALGMLAAIGLAAPAEAAPARTAASELCLEARRPDFDSGDDMQLISGSLRVSGRLRLSDGAVLLADGLLYRLSIESDSGDTHSQTAFGNPFLGFEARVPGSAVFVGAGIRFPVADEEKSYPLYLGLFADLDRWEGSITNGFPVEATIGLRVRNSSGVGVEGRLTPTLWHATEGSTDDVVHLRTAGTLFAEGPNARGRVTLLGRADLTRDEGDFGERTLFAAELAGSVRAGAIWPGLVLQIPLDRDLREELNLVLGLNITYAPEGPR